MGPCSWNHVEPCRAGLTMGKDMTIPYNKRAMEMTNRRVSRVTIYQLAIQCLYHTPGYRV
jgi:hypothetical protein